MSNRVSDYIPRRKAEFILWLKSFVAIVVANDNHYGINKEVIKILQELAEIYGVDITTEIDLLNKKLEQFKKSARDRKAVENVCRKIAQGIKSSLDYTDDVGRKFDILAPDNPFDPDTFKPVLKLKKKDHGVEVSFNKSETDGINLYRRMTGETDFTFISRDTNSPYIDNKDITAPVKIEYYAMAVIDDEEIGLESDTAKITI